MENQEKLDDVNVFADDSLDQEQNNEEQQDKFDDSDNDVFDGEQFVDEKYERVLLDGKVVTAYSAGPHMPKERDEWELTLKKNHYKINCGTKIEFGTDNNDREFYSGFMIIKDLNDKDDVTKPIPSRYTEKGVKRRPTCDSNGKSQMADILKVFRKYIKRKNPELTEEDIERKYGWNALFTHLKTKPKVLIEVRDVTNPKSGKSVKKNFIKDFVDN